MREDEEWAMENLFNLCIGLFKGAVAELFIVQDSWAMVDHGLGSLNASTFKNPYLIFIVTSSYQQR